jgi:hypothetical protein
MWFGRSPAWRAGAVIAAIALAGAAWYLGSPLFIRTTLNEDLPAASSAPTAAAQATAAGTSALTRAPATVAPTAAAGPVVLAEGQLQFVDSLHNGKGPVRLVRVGDQRLLRFEDVAITNAPDVHVYLSRETGGKWSESTSLYLGALKATNGSFNYDIPANADLSLYKSVVVWCRAFSVLVTWADLKPA